MQEGPSNDLLSPRPFLQIPGPNPILVTGTPPQRNYLQAVDPKTGQVSIQAVDPATGYVLWQAPLPEGPFPGSVIRTKQPFWVQSAVLTEGS